MSPEKNYDRVFSTRFFEMCLKGPNWSQHIVVWLWPEGSGKCQLSEEDNSCLVNVWLQLFHLDLTQKVCKIFVKAEEIKPITSFLMPECITSCQCKENNTLFKDINRFLGVWPIRHLTSNPSLGSSSSAVPVVSLAFLWHEAIPTCDPSTQV